MKTIKAEDIHAKHMAEDPAYREAYEALEGEFAIINALIQARAYSKLSHAEIASRMGMTESALSRLEAGRANPTARTLERYAKATGHRLQISFVPTSG